MTTTRAQPSMKALDRTACLELLAGDEVGRLAVISGGTPAIFPVNYRLHGEAIVFRTDPGTKLDDGPRARASFEIDHIDRAERTGWSVVVTGRLEEITRYDWATLTELRELGVEPWAAGEKSHWMRLTAERVTGRRIQPPSG